MLGFVATARRFRNSISLYALQHLANAEEDFLRSAKERSISVPNFVVDPTSGV
jgi:hypothetical protein